MKQRIITAIIALIIFIPTIIYGQIPFVALTFLIASIGLYEFIRTSKLSSFLLPSIVSVLFLWIILLYSQDLSFSFLTGKIESLFLVLMILLLSYTVLSKNKFSFANAGTMLLGTIYISISFYLFITVREMGLQYLLFVLFIIWTTDTGAYFSGRFLGKRKLWPAISPNKTIEGAIGGFVLSIVVGLIFSMISSLDLPLGLLLLYAGVISITGQLGDLVASALKRHFAVKDFGHILPGHGGILDRFDSLLFVLPILYVLQFM